MTIRHKTCIRRVAARGFTLIELVIALGIGVGILLALTLMFSSNSGNQQELERTLRQVENGRFAMDTLMEDLQHAGFYSDISPARGAIANVALDPCAATPAALAANWDLAATPWRAPRAVQGIPAGIAFACLPNRRDNTEAITIRHAETTGAVLIADSRFGNLYIQTPRCATEWGPPVVAARPANNPQGTFNLRPAACTLGAVNNEVRRDVQRTYYIATCNDCDNNDGVPTLKRVEMVDGALRTTSIAEGVENLQFEFGVDNLPASVPPALDVGDNLIDAWQRVGVVAAGDWGNVLAVRVHMLTRATQPTPGFRETRTYQLGAVSLAPANLEKGPNGNEFKRSLLSMSVRLNNVGGRRE